jgi:hypothetical protein
MSKISLNLRCLLTNLLDALTKQSVQLALSPVDWIEDGMNLSLSWDN